METALTTQLELPNLFPETPPRGVGRGCGLGLAPRNPASVLRCFRSRAPHGKYTRGPRLYTQVRDSLLSG